MKLQNIKAVTKVTGAGQMVAAVMLEYDDSISSQNLRKDDYRVKSRNITEIYSNANGKLGQKSSEGRYVFLELDLKDQEASVKRRTGKGMESKLKVASVELEILLPGETIYRTIKSTINITVDIFHNFTFEDPKTGNKLDYNLFIPQDIKAERRYPLVLFMHDAGACSDDIRAPLIQGNGATIWAEDFSQRRHPCFVLAPKYPNQAANDDYEVTWEADATISLVKSIMKQYPVDEKRFFGTGQSMGCMMLCELMLRNPNFFAACFLVAGQWNPDTMGSVKDENLWILVSEMDGKAFPIMGNCMKNVEKNGGRVVRGSINAKDSLYVQNEVVRKIARTGEHIFFTWFEKDSVLPDDKKTSPGSCHSYTWVHAYDLVAIQDWLFAQSNNRIDFSCKHDVLLEDENGKRLPMDVPYFHSNLIAPGTWQISSDGDYFYLVEGENEALVIDCGYGCGNPRAYCQSLTEKPVKRIANTHDHFDHTANNCYFDCAYMSKETQPLATIPFPSFSGINFPRDYPVVIIDDGYIFDLGGREIETFKCPDHAVGSLLFLDKKEGILFCGDELCMPFGKELNGSVEHAFKMFGKLQDRIDEIKILYGGPGKAEKDTILRLRRNMKYIMDGHEGNPLKSHNRKKQTDNPVVYLRRMPHTPDKHENNPVDIPFMREMEHENIKVIYDSRKIFDNLNLS